MEIRRTTVAGRAVDVLTLQRRAGNRATIAALSRVAPDRILARCPDCRGTCAPREPVPRKPSHEEIEAERLLREAVLARTRHPTVRQLQRQPLSPPSNASCQVHFRRASTQTVSNSERDECLRRARQYVTGGGQRRVQLHGYASEEGDLAYNDRLARRRAERVRALLVQAGVPDALIMPSGHGEDTTYSTREANRRVEVVLVETINFDPEQIVSHRYKCGPNVTEKIERAIGLTRRTFAGWSEDQKTEACEDLRSVSHGDYAWDIVELHNNAWILNYRPMCATQGASPPCGSTVQVGNGCHYAGSPNYVIFGVMCKLCYDHFWSINRAGANVGYTGYMDFDESSMIDLVDLYKSSSGNVVASKRWARAGYRGWPSGASTPRGDRPGCAPECPQPYTGPDFRVNWYPHMFHTGSR